MSDEAMSYEATKDEAMSEVFDNERFWRIICQNLLHCQHLGLRAYPETSFAPAGP